MTVDVAAGKLRPRCWLASKAACLGLNGGSMLGRPFGLLCSLQLSSRFSLCLLLRPSDPAGAGAGGQRLQGSQGEAYHPAPFAACYSR